MLVCLYWHVEFFENERIGYNYCKLDFIHMGLIENLGRWCGIILYELINLYYIKTIDGEDIEC